MKQIKNIELHVETGDESVGSFGECFSAWYREDGTFRGAQQWVEIGDGWSDDYDRCRFDWYDSSVNGGFEPVAQPPVLPKGCEIELLKRTLHSFALAFYATRR